MIFAHLLFAYLILGEPWLGAREYRRLRAEDNEPARLRAYAKILILEWSWVAVLLLLLGLGVATPAELGLRAFSFGPLAIFAAGFALFLALAPTVVTLALRRSEKGRAEMEKAAEAVGALFPETKKERALWTPVAFTAGFCEELVFRGFLFWYLPKILPLSGAPLLAATALVFGMAHAYQGWKGFLGTALYGLVFGFAYQQTGNLALPMLAHTLTDWRVLLLPPRRR